MAKTTAGIPQGTRDFGPEVVRRRQYIFNTIREVFELYGFQPLETPAMENLDTLMGKYGEEGDKLIFKILNNGLDNPSKETQARQGFENVLKGKSSKAITERALKYDLTIPFARFVAMNHGQLNFPFKRYQIQPVWRADRPQKGRYREFYQCDADIVGSNALLNEVELTGIYADVFQKLALDVTIRINNRKILAALAEACGVPEKLIDITVAIDKLDKIGLEKVMEEIVHRGIGEEQTTLIRQFLQINGSNTEKLVKVTKLLGNSKPGEEGAAELLYLVENLPASRQPEIDFTLARGLNYYTGTIFEVTANGVQIGSIGGGGRYDDLTGLFGVPNIPGVGISFGVDRIYDVLEELDKFPPALEQGTRVLFFNLGTEESKAAYSLLTELRVKGVPAEIYHEEAKFDKQFRYAERKNIPFIVIIGSKEMHLKACVVKDLRKGEQKEVAFANLSDFLFI